MSVKSDDVMLCDKRIIVNELNALQVDEVFEKMEAGFEVTRLDQLMLPQMHIPEFALNMMTEPFKLADFIKEHQLAPSEYALVYEKAKEVNNFLSQALQMYREKQERATDLQSLFDTMVVSGGPQST